MRNDTANGGSRDEARWYYQRENESVGPLATQELVMLAKAGLIGPQTILRGQDGQRVAASQVVAFDISLPATTASATVPVPERARTTVMPPPPPDAPLPPPPPDAVMGSPPWAKPGMFSTGIASETGRAREWGRLREIARRQRVVNMAFAAVLVVFPLTKGVATVAGSSAVDSVLGQLAAIAVTAFWVRVIVKLARALDLNVWLYGVLGIVPLLNFLVLLQLSRKATESLRAAGIVVGFLGTELPELPPPWFPLPDAPLGTGAATVSAVAHTTELRPSRLVVWRKRFFRSFVFSLLVGVVLFGGIIAADPRESIGANAVMVPGWIAFLISGASFVFYVVTGLLQRTVGAGKAIRETTIASLASDIRKPPH